MELGDDVRAFLEEKRFGVLGTINASGSPQQTVMWYQLRGDAIMMNTARGRRKDRNLLRDPRASLCIEDGPRYVTLDGSITINANRGVAQADIAALATRYEGADEAAKLVQEAFAKQERITLILNVDRVEAHGFDGEG